MLKEVCPKCHQPSFSSCSAGTWICPTCNKDLTHVKYHFAENGKDRPQLIVFKKLEMHAPEVKPYMFKSFD